MTKGKFKDREHFEETLAKTLFPEKAMEPVKTGVDAPSKSALVWELCDCLEKLKRLKEMSYTLEEEFPDHKGEFEKIYSAYKNKVSSVLKEMKSAKGPLVS